MLIESDQFHVTPNAFININKNLCLSHVVGESQSVIKAHHVQVPVMQQSSMLLENCEGKSHQ